ncbi:polyketide cyclase/dehydrase/lipid transport protein [Herbihabitans rhizosphaerae]|uniref:Polyketide cyclase/dehydrase/lipid transport protein n=1 Tax=Herbihabitans rhizosphaerae TaxID=1872711 RepID=A0A4Q7KZ82_9PSEU|nr:SRPBCC family protein [Herbihabitans rhizosphaerae]RZS41391.1 polyketide cyclase/dehydrase/lipid transport protein [Herbihabitans rhizosphaerae]
MAPIVTTIEIARSPREVFAFVADPTLFAEWQDDVVSVRMEDGASPGVGARFATTRRMGGAERTTVQEITSFEEPTTWRARGVDGPIRPDAAITVEPVNGGAGSRITFSLDFQGTGPGVALVPLVRRQARKSAPVSYEHLRRLLEGGA